MDEITLEDYRCFHGRQKVPLAPLTLLVGENSTGKTSFLAMVRALWDVAYADSTPDFAEEPYDLGSFFEIAHDRGRGGRSRSFEAGFRVGAVGRGRAPYSFDVKFVQQGTVPFPSVRRWSEGQTSVRAEQASGSARVIGSTAGEEWSTALNEGMGGGENTWLVPMFLMVAFASETVGEGGPTKEAVEAVRTLQQSMDMRRTVRPFASAPVRSKPQRTYNPRTRRRDPEGDYVPMYLAELFRRKKKDEWNGLKERLEDFGKAAGLFDELSIRSFGARESEPFQVQVRKLGKRTKGPWRNLMDVGYGVSQVLPLITELLRPEAPSIFLLQQPEVHLHPSAQAALGTLFGEVAKERQLIVETHSDHLMNRIRMDVRDGTGWLTPETVSILYFERNELEVNIHSLRFDDAGNIVDAPPSYRRFFKAETRRSLKY